MYLTRQEYRQAWDRAYEEDPPVPLNVDIELASTCNAKCTFCLYGDRDWVGSMVEKDWDGKPKKRFMPKDMAFKIIAECAELGVPALKFNFKGESVLHPSYGDIIEHAAKFGRCGQASCRYKAFHDLLANTNGNIPDALWDSGIRGLMACTKVMVSLDSLDYQIYSKVRVGLDLDRVKDVIDELVRRGHPDLWVRRVVCKSNKDEDFVSAAKKRWPAGVKVSEHFAFDRNHYAQEEMTGDDYTKWPRKYCGYPSQRVVLEASGSYVPCCVAWEGEFQPGAGRWPGLNIKDYWKSSWRKQLTQELRGGVFNNSKCKNCTSFMAYDRPERSFVEDREGYARRSSS